MFSDILLKCKKHFISCTQIIWTDEQTNCFTRRVPEKPISAIFDWKRRQNSSTSDLFTRGMRNVTYAAQLTPSLHSRSPFWSFCKFGLNSFDIFKKRGSFHNPICWCGQPWNSNLSDTSAGPCALEAVLHISWTWWRGFVTESWFPVGFTHLDELECFCSSSEADELLQTTPETHPVDSAESVCRVFVLVFCLF